MLLLHVLTFCLVVAQHEFYNVHLSHQSDFLRRGLIRDHVPHSAVWGASFVAHSFIVSNPLQHFSVLPPWKGCGRGLSTPEETAKHSSLDCLVATNAGFFDPKEFSCIGPLVHKGKWRNHEFTRNALFGIEQQVENATYNFVIGYLNETEMRKRKWLELVSGVVWLVRDGKSFVDESLLLENFSSEGSGSAQHFAWMKAPRLAVGHDLLGRIVIVAVDGSEPDDEGISLFDFASILVEFGVVNAINLDGGGSVSVYEKGTLINVPSDACTHNATFPSFRCPRLVSSILCVHQPQPLSSTYTPSQQLSTSHSLSVSHSISLVESSSSLSFVLIILVITCIFVVALAFFAICYVMSSAKKTKVPLPSFDPDAPEELKQF